LFLEEDGSSKVQYAIGRMPQWVSVKEEAHCSY